MYILCFLFFPVGGEGGGLKKGMDDLVVHQLLGWNIIVMRQIIYLLNILRLRLLYHGRDPNRATALYLSLREVCKLT